MMLEKVNFLTIVCGSCNEASKFKMAAISVDHRKFCDLIVKWPSIIYQSSLIKVEASLYRGILQRL